MKKTGKSRATQGKTQTEQAQEYGTYLSLPAARPFGKVIMPRQDSTQSASAIVASFSMFGIAISNPIINWICFFILLSIIINGGRNRSRLAPSVIALISCIFGTAFLYNRLLYGIVSRKSLLQMFIRE